jgi:hypothetical protein
VYCVRQSTENNGAVNELSLASVYDHPEEEVSKGQFEKDLRDEVEDFVYNEPLKPLVNAE